MLKLCFLALAVGMVAAVRATAADATDANKLIGAWMVVSGQEDGKPSPEDRIKGSRMTVDKKSIQLTDKDEKQLWVLDYKTDDSKTPHWITMTVKAGADSGKSSEGIYEVDGDTLKICYGLPGADRPKDFKATAGSKENCFVLKRVVDKSGK